VSAARKRGCPPGPSREEYRAAEELRASLRTFLRRSEQVTRVHGLTEERYELLLAIAGAPDGSESASVKTLSERLQLATSSVTQLVRRAEDLGLVRREVATHDARVRYLRLTEEGERRLSAAFAELSGERERLSQVLAHADR
jgi:DNA-binding MarR family transcriptional regulator